MKFFAYDTFLLKIPSCMLFSSASLVRLIFLDRKKASDTKWTYYLQHLASTHTDCFAFFVRPIFFTSLQSLAPILRSARTLCDIRSHDKIQNVHNMNFSENNKIY